MNQTFLQNYCKKETEHKLLKLNNSICDTKNDFPMQKVKTIFKIRFEFDLITPGFKESRFLT